jgi:hypothetical protein
MISQLEISSRRTSYPLPPDLPHGDGYEVVLPTLAIRPRLAYLWQEAAPSCCPPAVTPRVSTLTLSDCPRFEAIEHRRGDRRVVEDAAPAGDAEVGGERDGALQVALADDLEEGGGP